MTKKKTSIEKLEGRNEKVKDLKSALTASLWKWREVRYESRELWKLVQHTCGFCMYSMQRRTQEHREKCSLCPPEIHILCTEIQEKTSKLMNEFDEMVEHVFETLAGLKYPEGDP